MHALTDTFTLANGTGIPCLGFGTWKLTEGEKAVSSIRSAIDAGYRHIDTAAIYGNEKSVGTAVRNSDVSREEIFITSKLWNTERGYDKTLTAFDRTMADLQLDYLDLYLIHWPADPSKHQDWREINADTWKAFEKLYRDSRVKAIGVSNFQTIHLQALLDNCQIDPMVNQIEYHPGEMQREITQYCDERPIIVEAWSPLGDGRLLQNPVLKKLAAKYNKSVAQICIKWCLQNNRLPLPKSATPSHIIQNAHVFDFELHREDMEEIDNMDPCGGSGLQPDTIDF